MHALLAVSLMYTCGAAAYLDVCLTASCQSVQAIRRGLSPQPSAFRPVEQTAAAASAPAMDSLAILAHLASQVPSMPHARTLARLIMIAANNKLYGPLSGGLLSAC